MVADPRLAKEVLTGDPEVFRAGDTNGIFRPVVGSHSILLLDGDEHMRHRRILLPAFGGGHGQRFADQVREIAEAGSRAGSRASALKLQRRDGGDLVRRRSCASPSATTPTDRQRAAARADPGDDGSLRLAVHADPLVPPRARRPQPLRAADARSSTRSTRSSTRRSRSAAPTRWCSSATTRCRCWLRAGHEDGTALADREIRDELLTLIMAGYETTTSGLAWSFERLLRSPEQLTRLLAELEAGDERYLDAVVKETLRPRPVVPVVARRLARLAPSSAGYTLPAGTVLMVSIYLLHNDPETLSRARGVPARAVPRRDPRGRRVDPLRRRRAPLPRRQLRAARDEGRAARGADEGAAAGALAGEPEPEAQALHLRPRRRDRGAGRGADPPTHRLGRRRFRAPVTGGPVEV